MHGSAGVSCQRWSGAAFGCVVIAKKDKVKIDGQIKKYDYTGFNKDEGMSNLARWSGIGSRQPHSSS